MGFFDFVKNLFGKKETTATPTSPSETPPAPTVPSGEGQFMTPPSTPTPQPASTPTPNPTEEKPAV